MATSSDAIALLFRAKGDTADAAKAFNDLRSEINKDVDAIDAKGKSGFNSFAQSMGISEEAATSLAAAMPAIGAAVAAVGTVVAATVVGLFRLAQSASDAGSELFDAKIKTDLSAATLGTLKINADSAGASFESITGSVGKFNVLLGESKTGNEKAAATLAQYGITAKDTQGALEQAIKAIAGMESADLRAAAAKELFKDKTGDLLPVIDQMAGDLAAATERAKQLGLTLSEDDIRAADEFGDAWGQLSAQIKVGSERFALAYAPLITDALNDISEFLAENKDAWSEWGIKVSNTIVGVEAVLKGFSILTGTQFQLLGIGLGDLAGYIWTALNPLVMMADALEKIGSNPLVQKFVNGDEQYGPAASDMSPAKRPGKQNWFVKPDADSDSEKARKDAAREAERVAKEAERERKRAAAEQIRDEKQKAAELKRIEKEHVAELKRIELERVAEAKSYAQDSIARFQADKAKEYAVTVQYAAKYQKTEADLAKFKELQEDQILEYRKNKLDEYYKELLKGTGNGKEIGRVQQEQYILEQQIEEARAEHAKNQQDRDEAELEHLDKIAAKREEAWQKFLEELEEKVRLENEDADRKAQQAAEDASVTAPGSIGGGIAGALGVNIPSIFSPDVLNTIKSQAEFLKDIYKDIKNTAGQAIGSMIQGLAQLAMNWVLTGKFSAKAALQMVSGILMSVAIEAGVKAYFEYAAGTAALATTWGVPNPSSIAHFAAAAMYTKTALIAGGIGVGVGLLSRAVGGGSGGGGGSVSSAASGPSGTGQGRGNDGGVFSSKEDLIVEQSRNAPGGINTTVTLRINDRSDWFAHMFKLEMEKGGMVRQLILDAN